MSPWAAWPVSGLQLTFAFRGVDTLPMPVKTAKKPKSQWQSRAVIRTIEAGSSTECAACGERVKFQAKIRKQQVICNVYVDNRWDRVEHYHLECYLESGEPYGSAAA